MSDDLILLLVLVVCIAGLTVYLCWSDRHTHRGRQLRGHAPVTRVGLRSADGDPAHTHRVVPVSQSLTGERLAWRWRCADSDCGAVWIQHPGVAS